MKESEVEAIKQKIKTKFGSISRFSRVADLDRGELQKAFMNFYFQKPEYQTFLTKISKLADEVTTTLEPGDIDPRRLEDLRSKIDQSGGVVTFCKDNPKFSRDSVFQILSGRRKKMSPVIENLFLHFEIV